MRQVLDPHLSAGSPTQVTGLLSGCEAGANRYVDDSIEFYRGFMDDVDRSPVEPAPWCLVANVVAARPYGPGGEQVLRGLRLFAGGAKVFVVSGFGGMGWETLTVIGHHRKAGKYITVHVPVEHLTNWRVKPVYSPAVLRAMEAELGGYLATFVDLVGDATSVAYRSELLACAQHFSGLAEKLRDERLVRIAWAAALGPGEDEPAG